MNRYCISRKYRIHGLIFCLALSAACCLAQLSTESCEECISCESCGATKISPLRMYCPDCGELLSKPGTQHLKRMSAELEVTIAYHGKNRNRLPGYAKVYINDRYLGNIPLSFPDADSPARSETGSTQGSEVCTAFYTGEYSRLDPGLVKVTIEMRFPRFFGLLRSIKRFSFEHAELKAGEKTVLTHKFKRAAEFHLVTPSPERGKVLKGTRKTVDENGPGIEMPVFE